ncbi:NAC domain-containing protein 6-like [Cornus florida]|uniref:NAC domain-containing protein 6-like n=1 Tax=Cornus florida TaxID=4283 RepID=UPI00289FFD22|nr:NAC domain-containing protein 6-like [Cornus florida]
MDNIITQQLELPGFRFHPTEEELLNFYLRKIATGKQLCFNIIGFLNIYHHDPWELPGLAKIGEREWYFFVPRDRRHGHGGRPSRTTENGFWKATGSDRQIRCLSDPKIVLGLKKTLVFYKGKAPRGRKTDWVMNEYRLADSGSSSKMKEEVVLCKIYRKATSYKVLEERAAMEGHSRMMNHLMPSSTTLTQGTPYCHDPQDMFRVTATVPNNIVCKTEEGQDKEVIPSSSLGLLGSMKEKLVELEVPKFSMESTMDPLWTQLRSPWLDSLSPYANMLNF